MHTNISAYSAYTSCLYTNTSVHITHTMHAHKSARALYIHTMHMHAHKHFSVNYTKYTNSTESAVPLKYKLST